MNPVESESPSSQHHADEEDDELKKTKKELEDVQKKLTAERKNHEKTKETLHNLELKWKVWFDEEDLGAKFRVEKEKTENLRERTEKLKEKLGKLLDIKSWKACTLCCQEFSKEGDMIPRSLQCGHTICSACLRKLIKPTYTKCPFDGIVWRSSTTKTVDDFPKNYKVLDI
ncbi:hypothetical protein GCK72_009049 [Caenorhabditis remanei]|uniref:RING-type domain-containing protein n=1 Tax=Caenorhabditis remanei TaxID=31234 RepID=A0A6A5H1A7_CAERE|nr:hypothetical protein GCK72_009049 [Caenorhabditis remanei]KAF1760799.1 hypothetical protein GCK72_009049 [Caenorhabditis remanei]